jgi:predicted Zn-dependent protease
MCETSTVRASVGSGIRRATYSRAHVVAAMLLAGILASFPVRGEEPQVVKAIYNTFSDEEEMAMGRNAAAEVEKKYPILQDVILETYLDQIGQKVAQASRRPQLVYRFKLVDTLAVNAFSLPGGYVYVHRGLLEFAKSEDELVGVLAHEVGHIVAYHSMNDVARRWLVSRVVYEGKKAGWLDDQQIQDALQQYGGALLLFVDRKFSREEENEADLLGLYNTERAGWDPNGLIAFLNRVGQFDKTSDLMQTFLRRHPLPGDRVDMLRAELRQSLPSSGLTKNSFSFKAAKARLGTLPPPPAPSP